jgi:hypothetical protein
MHPPRALYCEFPFGRPLGKPGDAAFQRRVLAAAFALLERPSGPVLEDFPESVHDESATPLTCALPPRMNADDPPAIDEARALRAAYERQRARTGRTSVGKAGDADAIPSFVGSFIKIAEGGDPAASGLPSDPHQAALDIRAYYEEAALALSGHVPGARSAESWFFRSTEAGRVLRVAQQKLVAAGHTDYLATIVPRGQEL